MKPTFYILGHATDGIGRSYPQHEFMGADYDYDAPDSVHELSWEKFPDPAPNFRTVYLGGAVKLTDVISSSPIPRCGLLVSDHFKKILERHRLPPHQYFKAPVVLKDKKVKGYWWLHILQPRNANGLFDFANTEFTLEGPGTGKSKPTLKISTAAELTKAMKETPPGVRVVCRQYALRESFLKKIDLFCIYRFDLDFHISGRLRNEMLAQDITGVKISRARKLKP